MIKGREAMQDKYTDSGVNFDSTQEVDIARPKMLEIVILNDDYTSVDFVINLLMTVFNKNMMDAQSITQYVHSNGEGSCGVYPYDIGEFKHALAMSFIRDHGMPLRIIMRDFEF